MEQKTFYVNPKVKFIILNKRDVICTSPSVGSESFQEVRTVDLDD